MSSEFSPGPPGSSALTDPDLPSPAGEPPSPATSSETRTDDIFAIERPDSSLLTYYTLRSAILGPLFFLVWLPLYFRYRTLRYTFDEEGVSMAWGILFRREIHLTYSRIQDIHLVSNVVERWLGLARVQIQTASGSSKAEMVLEGLQEYGRVRDFLYARMRGTQEEQERPRRPGGDEALPAELVQQLVAGLGAVTRALEAVERRLDEGGRGVDPTVGGH